MRRVIQRLASALDRAPGYFRQDVTLYELNRRFLWFVVFRFTVVFLFFLLAVTKDAIFPQIPVSRFTFFIMACALLVANFLYWFFYKKNIVSADPKRYPLLTALNVQVQILVDFSLLGYLAYLCGGIESPLVYFFLFHCVISCLFFSKKFSIFHTLLSLAIIFFITLGPFFGLIKPHHFLFPNTAAGVHDNWIACSYHLAGISAVYLIVWFFAANITDSLKKHEEKLQDKIDELIQMDKEKNRYILVTTHELKAPFSSIQSYVNVIIGGYAGEISGQVHDVMLKIKTRCETMMKMITGMIQLANISSLKEKKSEVEKKTIDLSDMLKNIVRSFADVASAKGVNIALSGGDDFKVFANQEQLDILFNNILSNALTYCYPNTEIKVEVKEDGSGILVSVADKGIGIKKEHLEKVFLEYFRSEKAALINKNSTGLGLTIARQVMEIHNGRIWIESEFEVGTTIYMKFPKK